MDHVVPDWQTFGAEPTAPEHGTGTVVVTPWWRTPRVLALAGAASLSVVGSLVALAVLLVPSGGGVILDDGAGAAVRVATAGNVSAGRSQPANGTTLAVADGGVAGILAGALTVDVEGAVRRPGLIQVAAGDRIGDAIRLAGGFSPRADLRASAIDLNLAQSLTDGLKVVVPEIGASAAAPEATPAGDGSSGATGTTRVDLNTATQAELEALPGIGPVTAGHILEARAQQPFATVDDLRSRSLVGAATFDKLKALVTVAP